MHVYPCLTVICPLSAVIFCICQHLKSLNHVHNQINPFVENIFLYKGIEVCSINISFNNQLEQIISTMLPQRNAFTTSMVTLVLATLIFVVMGAPNANLDAGQDLDAEDSASDRLV